MKKIHFGIIGTGNITHRFIRGVEKVDGVEAYAVSSRNLAQAERYCEAYPGMKAYGDYKEMLQDANVDAVYIATPNATHVRYIMDALDQGKHVLCEKPMVLHEQDAVACFHKANQQGLLLMEAMKPCFLPTTKKAMEWIKDGRIGKLQYIEAGYCANGTTPFLSGWHAEKELGGGALYDIGVYPLGFVNHIEQSEILDMQIQQRILPSGVDAMSILQISYEDGVLAQLRCAVDVCVENQAVLYGTKGSIIIPEFWKSEKAILRTKTQEEVFYEPHDKREFQYQIRSFVEDIRMQRVENSIMSKAATCRNARVIDSLLWKKGAL